ncbi:nucleotidyl transferase AbiEii/AbiGii toxin family protein [Streptomyces sp. D2-8]|uniref:nucleotidyl transferase AbiEii/AbiGii toxin family protein n=1 Tax=Streptomyces sp. D2-8 TaxID=2707767 RepID=UPI0020C1234A|nr:nucleotidyl transferase AbiEii/AbiGii toxin family protein [Streptomyces sp. D2-8]MCK8434325.1 nucleotidyl transferase AbiEii/AbiGii toxin family protein [Streptomyces sp. D2-8]
MPAPPPVSEPAGRLLGDLLAVGEPYALVLAGGYAALAHGLVERTGRDVDVATEHPAAMEAVADAVRTGLVGRGWLVQTLQAEPLSAQFLVTDAPSGVECEVALHKEMLWRPPVETELGPALSLDDLVGTRVRDLADRGLARDLVDVHAASARWSHPELEELGRRHAPDTFDLTDLQARLTGTDWLDDRAFTVHGLDAPSVAGLRRWAQEWADDIAERLIEGGAPDED